MTAPPSLSSSTAITDLNGNAIVIFYPGAFVSIRSNLTIITQQLDQWILLLPGMESLGRLTATWKNYPYTSVTTNATPQSVRVNDTIDFTITVTGNGYKMAYSPVTVILDMDTTSNMNSVSAGDKNTNGLKRSDNAKIAAKTFVDNLSPHDQVGLVSYGD